MTCIECCTIANTDLVGTKLLWDQYLALIDHAYILVKLTDITYIDYVVTEGKVYEEHSPSHCGICACYHATTKLNIDTSSPAH